MALFTSRAPTYGVCIDWETSGSDYELKLKELKTRYQGISCGLVIFNTRTFDVIDTLYIELKFDKSKYLWSPEAEAIHGLSREYLEANGLSAEDAACEVAEFLLKYFGPNPKIMVMGHNVDFDIGFTEQLLEPYDLMFHIHHVKLDTACASFILFTTYKSDHLFELTNDTGRQLHNSLEDALLTVNACKVMRELAESALA